MVKPKNPWDWFRTGLSQIEWIQVDDTCFWPLLICKIPHAAIKHDQNREPGVNLILTSPLHKLED